jgi:hypothetical protein
MIVHKMTSQKTIIDLKNIEFRSLSKVKYSRYEMSCTLIEQKTKKLTDDFRTNVKVDEYEYKFRSKKRRDRYIQPKLIPDGSDEQMKISGNSIMNFRYVVFPETMINIKPLYIGDHKQEGYWIHKSGYIMQGTELYDQFINGRYYVIKKNVQKTIKELLIDNFPDIREKEEENERKRTKVKEKTCIEKEEDMHQKEIDEMKNEIKIREDKYMEDNYPHYYPEYQEYKRKQILDEYRYFPTEMYNIRAIKDDIKNMCKLYEKDDWRYPYFVLKDESYKIDGEYFSLPRKMTDLQHEYFENLSNGYPMYEECDEKKKEELYPLKYIEEQNKIKVEEKKKKREEYLLSAEAKRRDGIDKILDEEYDKKMKVKTEKDRTIKEKQREKDQKKRREKQHEIFIDNEMYKNWKKKVKYRKDLEKEGLNEEIINIRVRQYLKFDKEKTNKLFEIWWGKNKDNNKSLKSQREVDEKRERKEEKKRQKEDDKKEEKREKEEYEKEENDQIKQERDEDEEIQREEENISENDEDYFGDEDNDDI